MITFNKVTKFYQRDAHPALDDVSIGVERGEFVFLVGLSDSGEPTMLPLILAEECPTSGRAHVLGKGLLRVSQHRVPLLRRQTSAVFQDFRLLGDKNAYENVMLALQVTGAPHHRIKTEVPEVIEMIGLEDKRECYMTKLSGGERQRAAIAWAMVNRPQMLLVNEPIGNLDPETGMSIMRLLDRVDRSGVAIAMATHDQSIVNQPRKHAVGLKDGMVTRDEAHGVYGGEKQ